MTFIFDQYTSLRFFVVFSLIGIFIPISSEAMMNLDVHYNGGTERIDYYRVDRELLKINESYYFMGAAIADNGRPYIDILKYDGVEKNKATRVYRYDKFDPNMITGPFHWVNESHLYAFGNNLYFYTINSDRVQELYIFHDDTLLEVKKFSIRGNKVIPSIGEKIASNDTKETKGKKVWQSTHITDLQEYNGHLYFLVRRINKFKRDKGSYFTKRNFLYRTDGFLWDRVVLPENMRSGYLESMRVFDDQLTIKRLGNPGKLYSSYDGVHFIRNLSAQKLAQSFNALSFIGDSTLAVKGDRIKNYQDGRWVIVTHRRIFTPVVSDNDQFATIIPAPSFKHPGYNHWLTTGDGFTFYYNTLPLKYGLWDMGWPQEIDGYIGIFMTSKDSFGNYVDGMLLSKDGENWRMLSLPDYYISYTIEENVIISPVFSKKIQINDLPVVDVQRVKLPVWIDLKKRI